LSGGKDGAIGSVIKCFYNERSQKAAQKAKNAIADARTGSIVFKGMHHTTSHIFSNRFWMSDLRKLERKASGAFLGYHSVEVAQAPPNVQILFRPSIFNE
jgi:hypothetical protein